MKDPMSSIFALYKESPLLWPFTTLLLAAPVTAAPLSTQTMRQTLNFNREWKFQIGDQPGAENPAVGDQNWQSVGLPHSFSLPYFGSTHFYTGYGWYRKSFTAPAGWRGKRIFLDFEGAFQDTEVWVNGQQVGQHRGGYTGFEFEITGAMHDGENLVAVRVNNLWDARLAPRAGEHVFSGGIYRDVSLVVKNPLHVAWCGTFVSTPQVSRETATVDVKTEVVNKNGTAKFVTVRQNIWEPNGERVTSFESSQILGPGQSATFDQTSPPIENPQLWHPDHPWLYTVKTEVLEGESLADETSSPLGFRWFKWTADEGFFLNGEHLYLRGANVHQDHAGWGDAVTNAGFERDVKMVKDAGFNLIRGSHYPHDPAFSAACDRLGVLLWSECTFWGIGGFGPDGYWNCSAYPADEADRPDFEASVHAQLQEMVRIHRNHPSIIAWSVGNEMFFTEKSTIPRVKAFLRELVAASHQLDNTRPAAVGGAQRPLDENRIDLVGDIAGYNGDGASLPIFQNPGVPNIVSEYGSTTAIRPGQFAPGFDHLAGDNGQPVHAWRSGQVIWCAFDHGSIAGDNLGRMGIVDYFRIPKRAWYWYRTEHLGIAPPLWPIQGVPAKLRLEADKTTLSSANGTDDALLKITVLDAKDRALSNVVPVTLEIVSGPGEFPTGRSITFEPKSDIAILDGQAAIEFRSYHAGEALIRASSPQLESAEIHITIHGEVRWVEGVTPPLPARHYVRWTKAAATSASSDSLNLAADRPTKASSSATNFSSASVNDGRIHTFWRAAPGDESPWIQVDLENTYKLHTVRLTFPDAGRYGYRIMVSNDGAHWRTISDAEQNNSIDPVQTATGDLGAGIRAVRISFSQWPQGQSPALRDIAVGGSTA